MPRTDRSTISIAMCVIAGLVVTACTGSTPATIAPAATTTATSDPTSSDLPVFVPPRTGASRDAWLVVGHQHQDGLQVILASTQEQLYELPLGVPDRLWGTMVSATPGSGQTRITDQVVQPQAPARWQTIDGAWRLPTVGTDPLPVGVSPDGRVIVLVDASPAAGGDKSRFAVLSRTFDTPPRIIELKGSFGFDALSNDGSILYVVEHMPAPPAGHYQVRAVDVATGIIRDGVIVDKTGNGEAMAGYPIAQLRRPNGFVFTLYRGAEHPFIHALSSTDGWALCIDLPGKNAGNAAAALDWGLTPSADGLSVFAVNATLGLAVEVDPNDLSVRRTAQFDAPPSAAISLAKFGHQDGGPVGRRVIASPDGSTLYAAGSGGIVRIAADNLALTGTFLRGAAVDALGLTPDGGTLYALVHSGGRIVELDAGSGEVIGRVAGAGFDRLVAVVPW